MKKLLLCIVLPFALASLLRSAPAGLASIPFSTSRAQFETGDSITILEVLASSPSLQTGDFVVVKGEYRLQSRENAVIAVNITANESVGPQPVLTTSRKQIAAGTGTFELECDIRYAGSLHVTFYAATSPGNSFGGVYFATAQGSTTPTTPPITTPPTATPISPINTSGLTVVPFTTSRNQFESGDSITIQQVLSSSSGMQPGDIVVVRGEYNLQSRATALLMISLTVNAPGATETVAPNSRKDIAAGSGTFELAYEIRQPGSLHLSFYPLGVSGSSFGGIYFAPPQATGSTTTPTNPMSPISSALPALTYPTTNTGRLGNLSIRSVVGAGENTLVAGVTVTDQERYVLIRGVGPTLSKFGVTNFLKKPLISVYKTTGELVASGGSWSSAFTGDRRTGIDLLTASVGGFALTAGSEDAVVHLRLVPGGYTVVISSGDGTSGVALLEVYASPTYSLPVAP